MKPLRLAALLAALAAGPAGPPLPAASPPALSALRLVTDGATLLHPCTMEPLRLAGALRVKSETTLDLSAGHVRLEIDIRGVEAEGSRTARRWRNAANTARSMTLMPLPASATLTEEARFSAPGGPGFTAAFALHLAVEADGSARATLGEMRAECR